MDRYLPYLYSNFPIIYKALQRLYSYTPSYKAIQIRNKAKQQKDQKLLERYFKNKTKVLYGPFSGMKYFDYSAGSALLPKIVGTYEEPLHKWFYEVMNTKTETIIDIGAAEGYYAVGLARMLPKSNVHAIDIDKRARELNQKLADLNTCQERITLWEKCDYSLLKKLIKGKTLIICDIEGYEKKLLNPTFCRQLLKCEIIVELHSFYFGFNGLVEELVQRFSESHRIEIIVDSGKRTKVTLPSPVSDKIYFSDIVNERRTIPALWMKLTPYTYE